MTGFIYHTIIHFHSSHSLPAAQYEPACSLKMFNIIVERLQFFPSFKDFNT
jgi:hypothetical protein